MNGQDWFYRSLGFQPVTNKTNMIKVNSVWRDYWLLGFVYIHFWVNLKALHTCKQIFKKINKSTKSWNAGQFVAKTGFISWGTRFLIFVPKIFKICQANLEKMFFRPFFKKTALWRLSPYGYLTSYQISEKLLERFLRYAVTNVRTDERTRLIL